MLGAREVLSLIQQLGQEQELVQLLQTLPVFVASTDHNCVGSSKVDSRSLNSLNLNLGLGSICIRKTGIAISISSIWKPCIGQRGGKKFVFFSEVIGRRADRIARVFMMFTVV